MGHLVTQFQGQISRAASNNFYGVRTSAGLRSVAGPGQ